MRPIVLLAFILVLTLIIAAAVPTLNVFQRRLSPYGTGDEHISLTMSVAREEFGFEVANVIVGAETLRSLSPDQDTVVYAAFGVEREYSSAETDTILDLVDRGGRALVLDDFGHAEGLVGRFGVTLSDAPILDTLPEPSVFVRATILGEAVTLVRPAAILLDASAAAAGVEVLARTAPNAVLDLDGDDEVDETDPPDAYAVAIRIPHGKGEIMLVSDPTFVTNTVVSSQPAGLAFFSAYLNDALVEGSSRAILVVDESRHVQRFAEVFAGLVRLPSSALSRPIILGPLLLIHGLATLLALRRWKDDGPAIHEDGLDAPFYAGPAPSTLETIQREMEGAS